MPLNHAEAAASISVTGVSIGCINPAANRWEVAFIRHPSHSLMMEIVKESNGQQEIILPNSAIPVGCSITIEATNDGNPKTQIMSSIENTPEDFNLILDIEKKIYGVPVSFKERPEFAVTPLFVPRAELYTVAGKLTMFPVRLVREDDEDLNAVEVFGRIGTTAGADITCGSGDGEVTVRVEGEGGFVRNLPHSEGVRYFITLDNTCPPAAAPAPAPDVAEDTAAACRSIEVEEDSATVVRLMRKITTSGEMLVENHSDFVLCYALIEPPEGRDRFDLVDDNNEHGDGAVCINTHLGFKESIEFP